MYRSAVGVSQVALGCAPRTRALRPANEEPSELPAARGGPSTPVPLPIEHSSAYQPTRRNVLMEQRSPGRTCCTPGVGDSLPYRPSLGLYSAGGLRVLHKGWIQASGPASDLQDDSGGTSIAAFSVLSFPLLRMGEPVSSPCPLSLLAHRSARTSLGAARFTRCRR